MEERERSDEEHRRRPLQSATQLSGEALPQHREAKSGEEPPDGKSDAAEVVPLADFVQGPVPGRGGECVPVLEVHVREESERERKEEHAHIDRADAVSFGMFHQAQDPELLQDLGKRRTRARA